MGTATANLTALIGQNELTKIQIQLLDQLSPKHPNDDAFMTTATTTATPTATNPFSFSNQPLAVANNDSNVTGIKANTNVSFTGPNETTKNQTQLSDQLPLVIPNVDASLTTTTATVSDTLTTTKPSLTASNHPTTDASIEPNTLGIATANLTALIGQNELAKIQVQLLDQPPTKHPNDDASMTTATTTARPTTTNPFSFSNQPSAIASNDLTASNLPTTDANIESKIMATATANLTALIGQNELAKIQIQLLDQPSPKHPNDDASMTTTARPTTTKQFSFSTMLLAVPSNESNVAGNRATNATGFPGQNAPTKIQTQLSDQLPLGFQNVDAGLTISTTTVAATATATKPVPLSTSNLHTAIANIEPSAGQNEATQIQSQFQDSLGFLNVTTLTTLSPTVTNTSSSTLKLPTADKNELNVSSIAVTNLTAEASQNETTKNQTQILDQLVSGFNSVASNADLIQKTNVELGSGIIESQSPGNQNHDLPMLPMTNTTDTTGSNVIQKYLCH
jgi:hypothetical protein